MWYVDEIQELRKQVEELRDLLTDLPVYHHEQWQSNDWGEWQWSKEMQAWMDRYFLVMEK